MRPSVALLVFGTLLLTGCSHRDGGGGDGPRTSTPPPDGCPGGLPDCDDPEWIRQIEALGWEPLTRQGRSTMTLNWLQEDRFAWLHGVMYQSSWVTILDLETSEKSSFNVSTPDSFFTAYDGRFLLAEHVPYSIQAGHNYTNSELVIHGFHGDAVRLPGPWKQPHQTIQYANPWLLALLGRGSDDPDRQLATWHVRESREGFRLPADQFHPGAAALYGDGVATFRASVSQPGRWEFLTTDGRGAPTVHFEVPGEPSGLQVWDGTVYWRLPGALYRWVPGEEPVIAYEHPSLLDSSTALTDGFPVFSLGSMEEDGTWCTKGVLVRLEDRREQEVFRQCENFTGQSQQILGQSLGTEYTYVGMFADEDWLFMFLQQMPGDQRVDNLFRRPNPLAGA